MFNMYDHVRVKATGVYGTIVDEYGDGWLVIDPDVVTDSWSLIDAKAEELEEA
ncbi:hypothetical protein [uncultured Faecalibaculum sp.]|uniref:hypothetical protein n=1 Tax=uncultured Faecalibaculum sp. TaxID=1729681 RepID=UPI0025E7D4A1|nr:hypothetical protein [uncultured Faecalibaculum sp.]